MKRRILSIGIATVMLSVVSIVATASSASASAIKVNKKLAGTYSVSAYVPPDFYGFPNGVFTGQFTLNADGSWSGTGLLTALGCTMNGSWLSSGKVVALSFLPSGVCDQGGGMSAMITVGKHGALVRPLRRGTSTVPMCSMPPGMPLLPQRHPLPPGRPASSALVRRSSEPIRSLFQGYPQVLHPLSLSTVTERGQIRCRVGFALPRVRGFPPPRTSHSLTLPLNVTVALFLLAERGWLPSRRVRTSDRRKSRDLSTGRSMAQNLGTRSFRPIALVVPDRCRRQAVDGVRQLPHMCR